MIDQYTGHGHDYDCRIIWYYFKWLIFMKCIWKHWFIMRIILDIVKYISSMHIGNIKSNLLSLKTHVSHVLQVQVLSLIRMPSCLLDVGIMSGFQEPEWYVHSFRCYVLKCLCIKYEIFGYVCVTLTNVVLFVRL